MSDTRDFLARAQARVGNMGCGDMSADELGELFALYGPDKRVEGLEAFDAELAADTPTNLRRAAELVEFRRKLGSVHSTLLRAKR